MSAVGAGGVLMTAALAVYLYALARNLLPARLARSSRPLLEVHWGGAAADGARAWSGPLAIILLLGLTVVFTSLAFELMRALPMTASGGGAH
jgi:hypothetical protein